MMQTKPPNQYAPLPLAYIGDAVYEVYVRTRLIAEHPDMAAHKLHVHSIKYVKAHAQSNSIHALLPILTDDETAVFRRGRNAKSPTVPKNADLSDYRYATGLEALFGYLYLADEKDRLNELMAFAYEHAADERENK